MAAEEAAAAEVASKLVKAALVGLASAIGLQCVAVGVLKVVGFGAGGISKGSVAAGMMSSHGGSVRAGSVVAVCQSIGALGTAAAIPFAVAAAVVGAAIAYFLL